MIASTIRRHTVLIKPGDKVLLLEDNETRVDWFRSRVPWLDHAYNAAEALEFCRHNCYDVYFLDHDLSEYEQGYEVTDEQERGNSGTWFAKNVKFYYMPGKLPHVTIHTWNPAGAARMIELLRERVVCSMAYLPFATFDIEVVG